MTSRTETSLPEMSTFFRQSSERDKVIIMGHGLTITLDATQIFADDPGRGIPALVEDADGNGGSFHCVLDTADMDGTQLTTAQWDFLDRNQDKVDHWLDEKGA